MDPREGSRIHSNDISKGKFLQLILKIKELFKRDKDNEIFTSAQQMKKQQIKPL